VKRTVQPEFLDALPPDDPQAVRSRADLCRVNAWMGNHAIMADVLGSNWPGPAAGQITELGAGDGNFLLAIAKKIAQRRPNVKVTLLDRQSIVSVETLAAFAAAGWRPEVAVSDVFNWSSSESGIVMTN
jgi:hypothetical protein